MSLNLDPDAPQSLGSRISSVVSDAFAHPFGQIGIIVFCVAWFAVGLSTDLLTAALSILAITLTQMVLYRQNERECDAHRRDVALHAKLDELIIAKRGARDEMAGIEELSEDTIVELKSHAMESIDRAGVESGSREDRALAKRAIDKSIPTPGRPRDKSRKAASGGS